MIVKNQGSVAEHKGACGNVREDPGGLDVAQDIRQIGEHRRVSQNLAVREQLLIIVRKASWGDM